MPYVVQRWNGHDWDDRQDSVVGCFLTLEDSVSWCSKQDPRNLYNRPIDIISAFTIFHFEEAEEVAVYYGNGDKRQVGS